MISIRRLLNVRKRKSFVKNEESNKLERDRHNPIKLEEGKEESK